MSLAAKLLSASGGAADKLYVDDVFSAYTYTGNGSTQTITNGIDLAGKGGMVWIKSRSDALPNLLSDTAQGFSKYGDSASTGAFATTTPNFSGATSSGFTVDAGSGTLTNGNLKTYVGWTFRKAAKFFDVVTWTGDGSGSRVLSHALGIPPGLITLKRTDGIGSWYVYQQALGFGSTLQLETTSAALGFGTVTAATSTTFTHTLNISGQTYVAYLFAHDTSADGIVQCGSFTTDGSGNATVNLGWEPQYLMVKRTDAASNWAIIDSSRDFSVVSAQRNSLKANTSEAEAAYSGGSYQPNSTGFKSIDYGLLSATCVYLAIRRPNKPPTVGTQVYNAIARTGTGAAATVTGVGFAPDLLLTRQRSTDFVGYSFVPYDRLRGVNAFMGCASTSGEQTGNLDMVSFNMDGYSFGTSAGWGWTNLNSIAYIHNSFKRAPGVFDEVCYTGTGVAKTEAHGLGVVPELIIVKSRSVAYDWAVYSGNATTGMRLNTTAVPFGPFAGWWNSTVPTASLFTLGTTGEVNESTRTYVAYLFATKAGISKVGSYTGNGSSLTLNMGFTTGARFFMVKRTDSTGDWFVFDTTRGIIAGNDGHLSLNTPAAEVTTNDSVDPDTTGLVVNQVAATNINVTSATYIYLAFA